ncbi:unnamed protein product [Thlaspi arvense]|uniref:GDSL esterase/lipase n=1 Tax=Thlaspi arvense TaxID=13288 RepID=A0AAU9RSU8_THLAR|nr:unnamed protein product [Thlaspi arvense]
MEKISCVSYFALAVLCLSTLSFGKASAKVPALFIFGDSTADVGTNNFLPESQARADHPFYGIDFPNSTPTGSTRSLLCNGTAGCPIVRTDRAICHSSQQSNSPQGSKATGKLLSKSIFCISVGSNDIFGYFLSNSSIPKKQFFSTLLCQYEADVKDIKLKNPKKPKAKNFTACRLKPKGL